MKIRRLAVFACLSLILVASFIWWTFSATAEQFQRDADVIRLRHLQHYGQLIEEYREKTGRVPFQGAAEIPIYVNIANHQQAKYASKGPPTQHKLMSTAGFVSELESGIGRAIIERYDPQWVPTRKPNFYIYMVNRDYYFFAVHLHQPFPFAKRIADHYYKAEISNAANAQNKAALPEKLFASPEFVTAVNRPMIKPEFFNQREKEDEGITKRK